MSDKMNKTRVVSVARLRKHSRYHKYHKITTRFKAHDENNEYHSGDRVIIEQSRPLSKDKRWVIISLLERPSTVESVVEEGVDKDELAQES